jgi:hypothetical protein
MGIVASNKKVLEINDTYRHWQRPAGGRDEAHDATASGGSGQNSSSVSAQWEEREGIDFDRAGRVDGNTVVLMPEECCGNMVKE